jgi:small GTP-binding protein
MLGAAGTGKTSLVRRFVEGLFSEQYLSTIGVKIARKSVTIGGDTVNLALWDIEGETGNREARLSYLRGATGLILVVDGTDPATLSVAEGLHAKVTDRRPDLPCIVAINKADQDDRWRIGAPELERIRGLIGEAVRTSALNGEGVESMFRAIALRILPPGA